MVLNSIELNYSKSARDQYKIITQKYKDAGIFEALYNHYFHTNELKKFKYEIDHYFEHSFFVDSSFFFFTLSRSEKFDILFDIFLDFYLQKEHANTYFSLNTYVEKDNYGAELDEDDIHCQNIIKNQLKKLQFDIILYHGRPFNDKFCIEVFYDDTTNKLENWSKYEDYKY